MCDELVPSQERMCPGPARTPESDVRNNRSGLVIGAELGAATYN